MKQATLVQKPLMCEFLSYLEVLLYLFPWTWCCMRNRLWSALRLEAYSKDDIRKFAAARIPGKRLSWKNSLSGFPEAFVFHGNCHLFHYYLKNDRIKNDTTRILILLSFPLHTHFSIYRCLATYRSSGLNIYDKQTQLWPGQSLTIIFSFHAYSMLTCSSTQLLWTPLSRLGSISLQRYNYICKHVKRRYSNWFPL